MGIMLVYDITNEKSFENIIKWLRNIDEHANEDVERMILGNKCDMTDKRIVNKERGEAVSYNFSNCVNDKNKKFANNNLILDRTRIWYSFYGDISQSKYKY